jgi:hypothetical protein
MSEYTHPVSGHSGLDDDERRLLMRLTIENLCRQFEGCTPELAAACLDHFSERGEVTIEGDQRDVYVKVVDHVHIHAERDWLYYMAHRPDPGLN